jgi:DNA-binding transcriptional LysR family regulator
MLKNIEYISSSFVVNMDGKRPCSYDIHMVTKGDKLFMDIRQLRYFHTVAEQKQITRAAKKLHMTQPPLSQQLKLLEQELGVQLIERSGRKIELTEAGKILALRAEHILNKIDEAITEVKEAGKGLSGTLSIGIVKSYFSFLPEKIAYFKEKYPLVTFKIAEGDPLRLGEYLHNRDIELAFVRLIPGEPMNNYNLIQLATEPFVFVIPKDWDDDPLKTDILMRDLADYPLLMWHRTNGTGVYEMILKEFNRLDLTPQIIGEGADVTILLSLVASGIGASILPKSALYSFPTNQIKILDIPDCSLKSEIAVIWLKERSLSSLARRFIDTFTLN